MANKILPLITILLLLIASCGPKEGEENFMKFKKLKDTQEYFAYKSDSTILISGHRGGRLPGFPENSIEGFQHIITQIPVFYEVDPRLTKDSVIVLMHDETLDRTTNATGRLSDFKIGRASCRERV